MGTDDFKSFNVRIGNATHTHRVRGTTNPASTADRLQGEDFLAGKIKHHHEFATISEACPNIPPAVKVIFIMKL